MEWQWLTKKMLHMLCWVNFYLRFRGGKKEAKLIAQNSSNIWILIKQQGKNIDLEFKHPTTRFQSSCMPQYWSPILNITVTFTIEVIHSN